MKLRHKLGCGLLLACLSLSAWAMTLNEAMSGLGAAKQSGLVGEQPNGYLGVIKNEGQAAEIVNLINAARKSEYQNLARQNGISLTDVETMAGQKALEKTVSGQYIQRNGQWVRK